MFRYGWRLIGLIVLGVFVFLWLIKAPLLSSYLTDKMELPVNIGSISIWPKKTIIHRFTINNPYGYSSRKAFEVNKLVISYRFGALTANPSEIDLIVLEDVNLNIDIRDPKGRDNNWAAIAAQMPPHKKGKQVIIHKLIIRNLTVYTQGAGANALGVAGVRHFDQMEFDEINSADGFPTKELISRIFHDVGMMQYIQNLIKPVQQQIQNVIKPMRFW